MTDKLKKEKAIELRLESRYSYRQIQEQLGISKSNLSNWLSGMPLSDIEISERLEETRKRNIVCEYVQPPVAQKERALDCELRSRGFESLQVDHGTNEIGNITTSHAISKFISMGYVVLNPFGDHHRYDLVIEKDGNYLKIQCKTGRIRNGTITFMTSSFSNRLAKNRKRYRKYTKNDVDFFYVYCADNSLSYMIPFSEQLSNQARLRVDPIPKNSVKRVKWAVDYQI